MGRLLVIYFNYGMSMKMIKMLHCFLQLQLINDLKVTVFFIFDCTSLGTLWGDMLYHCTYANTGATSHVMWECFLIFYFFGFSVCFSKSVCMQD